MIRNYLTTTQAAKLCNVTRFTIRNWINNGRLHASRTVGGHRRILKDALLKFISDNKIARIRQEDSGSVRNDTDVIYRIPRCWEFHSKNSRRHNCVKCLVFKERANKCFLLIKEFGSESIQCQDECLNCEYFKKFYPSKKRVMDTVENDALRRFRGMIQKRHKKEEDVSVLLKKGFYVSGKYLASIFKSKNKVSS